MKILVVGLGSMGRRRIRILSKLLPAADICGIDTDEERRKQVSELHGIKCWAAMDAYFLEHSCTAAFICTSPKAHYAIAKQLLLSGSHVFSEINLLSEGYAELIELAKAKNLLYFLSSTPLYSPDRRQLTALVAAESSLTYMYHVGQYLPDWHPWEAYSKYFVGSKETGGCREIFAIELPWLMRTFGKVTDCHVSKKRSTDLEIDYDDTFIVTLTHEGGNTGVFCVDVVSRKAVRELRIYNQNQYITWNGTQDSIFSYNTEKKSLDQVVIPEETEQHGDYAEFINERAYLNEVIAFFKCLKGEAQPQHTLEKDTEVLRLIDRIEGY